MTLVSGGRLPVKVEMTFHADESEGGTIEISPKLPGPEVCDLQRVLEFLEELERSGQIQALSLDLGTPLMEHVGKFDNNLDISANLRRIIADAAIVAEFFDTRLCLPKAILNSDDPP